MKSNGTLLSDMIGAYIISDERRATYIETVGSIDMIVPLGHLREHLLFTFCITELGGTVFSGGCARRVRLWNHCDCGIIAQSIYHNARESDSTFTMREKIMVDALFSNSEF